MSKQTSDQNAFKAFMKGYWELPKTKPNLVHSFLRGAILSAILSLIFPTSSLLELLIWVGAVGVAWAAVDQIAWNYYAKRKGE